MDSQVVDGVQFAAGIFEVVHPADPGAELEPERGLVAHPPRHRGQVFPLDVEGQLTPVDDNALDRVTEPIPSTPIACSSASATSSKYEP